MVKFIVVEMFSKDDNPVVTEYHRNRYCDDLPYDTGMTYEKGEWRPDCFRCGNPSDIMIKLVEINDGCIDDYLCSKCIRELKELIDNVLEKEN